MVAPTNFFENQLPLGEKDFPSPKVNFLKEKKVFLKEKGAKW